MVLTAGTAQAAEFKPAIVFDMGGKVAKGFPNVRSAPIGMVVDLPNMQSIVFKEQESSFLVSVLAGFIGRAIAPKAIGLPYVKEQYIGPRCDRS